MQSKSQDIFCFINIKCSFYLVLRKDIFLFINLILLPFWSATSDCFAASPVTPLYWMLQSNIFYLHFNHAEGAHRCSSALCRATQSLLVSVECEFCSEELTVLLCKIRGNVQELTLQLVNPALRSLGSCRGARVKLLSHCGIFTRVS